MKILVVGNSRETAIEDYYVRYLREFGFNTEIFALNQFLKSSLYHKVLRYLFRRMYYLRCNFLLIYKVFKNDFDIIWVFKGWQIFGFVLRLIKRKARFIINYNPDHPFIRSFKSSGGRSLERAVFYYDLHLVYSDSLLLKFQNDLKLPCELLPFGYDMTAKEYELFKDINPSINKVCFVGNPDNYRVSLINKLSREGYEVVVFGYGWHKETLLEKRVEIRDGVTGRAFWSALRSFKVQVNIFREHNRGSHNMRFFEIPAVGGIQMVPDSPEVRRYFNPEEEIFVYKDFEELCRGIDRIFSLSENDLMKIRTAARLASIQREYSYRDRAKYVGNIFRKLIQDERD